MSPPVTDSFPRLGPCDRVMVIAPHPDDEVIATGGMLALAASHGARVRVVYVTDGENNPWAQRAVEGRWHIGAADRARWGVRRRREAIGALAHLGLPPDATVFLGLPDQRVTDCLLTGGDRAVGCFAAVIETWRPTLLFLPSARDRHPDHSATALIADLALCRRADPPPRVLRYIVHRPTPRWTVGSAAPALGAAECDAKRNAVLHHVSQLRLRRRFLMSFVHAPECFAAGTPWLDLPSSTSVLSARAGAMDWTLRIRRTLRMALNDARLMVLWARRDRSVSGGWCRIGAGVWPLVSGGRVYGEVTQRADHGTLGVRIGLPGVSECVLALARIDLQRERRLGCFDPWPWVNILGHPIDRARTWAVATASHVSRHRAAPVNGGVEVAVSNARAPGFEPFSTAEPAPAPGSAGAAPRLPGARPAGMS
jgi:LmbE family N-acetylglucosaminyl deacetylase